MKAALGFLSGAELDLASRLARFRWRRAVAGRAVEIPPGRPARSVFDEAELWVIVRVPAAIPRVTAPFCPPVRGRILVAGRLEPGPDAAHTLRELETARIRPPSADLSRRPPSALAVRPAELPPTAVESSEEYVDRLLGQEALHDRSPGFVAFEFDDPSERDRPELTCLFPEGPGRLLDVGCGSGGSGAAVKARSPASRVTGVERDAYAAARARRRLDRVLAGDALDVLDALIATGECFDRFLFADVLEHLTDPIEALGRARSLATRGAMLVASVPNVGHLSVVRDLLLGRFDPVPAGLCDAGHVRWFTRSSLEEALDESGWRTEAIHSIPGAPAPESEDFLSRFSDWPDLDRESLGTYQWVAVARCGT